jgi:hypothetical protein
VVKNGRVMVSRFPDNFEADRIPLSIVRMFCLSSECSARPWPVATMRRVPQFALSGELQAMLPRRRFPARRRGEAYRIDQLAPRLTKIDRA